MSETPKGVLCNTNQKAKAVMKGFKMWTVKKFKSFEAYASFIDNNKHRYQITPLMVNNAWAVEYKPLRKVY